MSVDLLGNLTSADCDSDRLIFQKGEVVEFICTEARLDENKGTIFVNAKVTSGLHAGKDHLIVITGGDHEVSKKFRAQFFFKSGFWTPEELQAKDANGRSTISLAKLVGRKFQAKASAVREKDGQKFQNMQDIRDLGQAPDGAADQVQAATY